MKIVVIGTRGIPDIQGGVETHCEELFPRLSQLGFDVILVRRSCYFISADNQKEFKGVKLVTLYAPHIKTLEALVHTFLAVIWARKKKADILHIHAVGPALLTPFARFLGLKVVFTHHGPDYNRAKWGRFAKYYLRKGEKFGTSYANEVIVISKIIQESLVEKYKRTDTVMIFNGVTIPVLREQNDYIESIGVKSRMYVFALGRFVEEKGFDLLIRAFTRINHKNFKLVIAGDSDHDTKYSKLLKKLAQTNDVILTGFIKGQNLQELFSHASLFVLPSYHEGLPISLLEAMSYGLPVLASDIPANKQVDLPENRFFISGNEESLVESLDKQLSNKFVLVSYDMTPYNWDQIAIQTKAVYDNI
jgi:glycosyltransferase involved in cell wall biosynthesis